MGNEALGPLLEYLDLAGIAVFALSGAMVAAVKRQTLVTFIFFAVSTAVGGGTVRDLLIGAPSNVRPTKRPAASAAAVT